MLADKHLFEDIGRILYHVEPVSHVHGMRRSPAHAVRIRSSPVAADNGDAGMIDQPVGQRLSAPVGQEIYQLVSLQVRQERPIGSAASETPVIHAQHPRGWGSGKRRLSHHAQHTVATRSSAAQSELLEQALTGLATERKADPFQLAAQQRSPSLIDWSGGRQPFSKRLAATGGVTTVKTPRGDPKVDGMGSNRDIAHRSGIPTMRPMRTGMAVRALLPCRDETRAPE